MDDSSLESSAAFNEWCKQALEKKPLPDILLNLSRRAIPVSSHNTSRSIDAVKLALQSLRGVQNYMDSSARLMQNGGNGGTAPKSIRSHWSCILAWMEYLDVHCIARKRYGDTLAAASLHAIALTSATISQFPTIRDVMVQKSGLTSLLARHWIQEEDYIHRSELLWEERYFSLALERLFRYVTDRSDTKVVEFITEAVGGSSTVTRISLEQLRSVLKSKKLDFSAISLYINLIHQASKTTPSLRVSLLDQGLVSTIVQFIDFLPVDPPATFPQNVQQCIKTCAIILVVFVETANGPSFIAQALDAGLLKGFLRLWPLLIGCRADRTLCDRFFDLLEDYIVYRSVLRSLGKALKKVDKLPMDASVAQCDPWLKFRRAALKQLDMKKKFEAESNSRLEPGFFGCENLDVREVFIPSLESVADQVL